MKNASKILAGIENKINSAYENIFKFPSLLAITAFILALLFPSELKGVTLYREMIIVSILSVLYTLNFKEIMTKSYKFKFALYFTLLFLIRDITMIIVSAISNTFNLVYIILGLGALLIGLAIKNILRPLYSYLALFIFNRIFILLTKIKNNIFQNALQVLINLVKKPKYIVSLILLIFFTQFIYLEFTCAGGKFVSTGEINTTRLNLSGVKMSNGKIFVLERDYRAPKTKFAIYNPSSKKLEQRGELITKLGDVQAIALKNGKVLILGYTQKRLKNKEKFKNTPSNCENVLDKYGELYDPNTDKVTLTGENLFPNFSFAMTTLSDGKVLIAGGAGRSNKSQIFDPNTNKFYKTGDLNEGRFGHTLIQLKNGNVLVIGGMANTAEIFNPKTLKYTTAASFKTDSWGKPAKAYLLRDERVFIVCKKSDPNPHDNVPKSFISIYDPKINQFQELKLHNKYKVDDFEASLLKDGKILITGGKIGRGRMKGYLISNQAEIFDPQINKFIPIKNKMIIPRYAHNTITLPDGHVLITGGTNNKQFSVKQAELFIP